MRLDRRQVLAGGVIASAAAVRGDRPPPVSAADFRSVAEAVATGRDVYFPAEHGPYTSMPVVVTSPGQRFFGDGEASVVRAVNPATHLFDVRAADVSFVSLRFEGAAESPRHPTFAIFTSIDLPAPRVLVDRCVFSGDDSGVGFANGVKLDTGADRSIVRNSQFERLWGETSGFGYGVLCGAASEVAISGNTFLGSLGRGRHAVYLSSGASYCSVLDNAVSNFSKDGITVYATDRQPSCRGNTIRGNTLVGCADAFTSGAISLAQNVRDTIIARNVIDTSGGCGIKSDGTGSTRHQNNHFEDNQVVDSQFIGIDLVALQGGSVTGNEVRESSRAATAVYSNIRCVSDGVTATSNIRIVRNRSTGRDFARSAFQTNATPPVPVGIVLQGNMMSRGRITDIEVLGGVVTIDGRSVRR